MPRVWLTEVKYNGASAQQGAAHKDGVKHVH